MSEEQAWTEKLNYPITLPATVQERRRGDVHICWINDDSFILTNRFDATAIVQFISDF